jgi:16S rRNA A1518/A1519 N6-dimethyltransferase RsmA/KsgA/DIM1 with predicted DNA glycosylase/AP lyase activity
MAPLLLVLVAEVAVQAMALGIQKELAEQVAVEMALKIQGQLTLLLGLLTQALAVVVEHLPLEV